MIGACDFPVPRRRGSRPSAVILPSQERIDPTRALDAHPLFNNSSCMTQAMTTIDLNADMGESFGAWTMGDDAALLVVVS